MNIWLFSSVHTTVSSLGEMARFCTLKGLLSIVKVLLTL